MDLTNPAFCVPPVFDGTNYPFWKVRIRLYIKSIDARAWIALQNGWSHPMKRNSRGDVVCMPMSEWSTEEKDAAKFNSEALNAIRSSLDITMFKLVMKCESAKEAWTILEQYCQSDAEIKEEGPSEREITTVPKDSSATPADQSSVETSVHSNNKNVARSQEGEEVGALIIAYNSPPSLIKKYHPLFQVIGDIQEGVKTRRKKRPNYREMANMEKGGAAL